MTFTVENLASAMSSYLGELLPDVTFYEDPRQQKTNLPCAFIQVISSDVKLGRTKSLLRTLRLDLTYLEDFNLTDLQTRYQRVSEILDLNLETFPYEEGLIRTYNRTAQIDLDALHYKFELRLWMLPEEDAAFMQSLEIIWRIRDGE